MQDTHRDSPPSGLADGSDTVPTPTSFRFGNVQVRLATREVLVNGTRSELRSRAFDLLVALIQRRDRVVTKDELLDLVWPNLVVEENNLQVHVSALRKLLGPNVITTIPGRGYRFTSELETDARDAVVPRFTPAVDVENVFDEAPAADLSAPVGKVRHNLRAERDTFVGRDAELRALESKLNAGIRLLTALGPAGTGKTRLLLRYGWTRLEDWPGGVYFCDLSEARSLDGVFFAVASALDVPLGKDDSAVQLGRAIGGRGCCLIILDNFEQVREHALATVGTWLDRAPDAAFVVTSRERLHIPGEEILPVEPLPLDKEAIELFAVRASAQMSAFSVHDSNRAAVTEVVRLLDGLPLAIELAAARVRVLSPAQLVTRLRDRFALLTRGMRGAATRQATLRAAIDWSWDLLAPWEQAALAQCSVFEGGFTLEAAESVLDLCTWPEAPTAMDVIQALVDKSLLRTWIPAAQGRHDIQEPYFGMYVSIREYATKKLNDSGPGAQQAVERRHGKYFAAFGHEAALETLFRHGGVRRRQALALEVDNLVSACRRAVARGDGEVAVTTYRALWEVLELQGPFALGVTLGAEVLAVNGLDAALLAAARVTRGVAAQRAGRMNEADTWLDQALVLCRSTNDRRRECDVLFNLGNWHREQGRIEKARSYFEAALAIVRELHDRRREGTLLGNLGNLHFEQGRLDEARSHYEAALAIHREVGNRRFEGTVLGNLGLLNHEQGRMDDARTHYQETRAIAREVGDRRFEGIVLSNLALLYSDQGQGAEAQLYYECALATHRELGDRRVEGIVLGNLGSVYRDCGLLGEAQSCYESALSIHREVGNRRYEGIHLGLLGSLHRDQGLMKDGLTCCSEALVILREVGDRNNEASVLGNLADIFVHQGQLSEANEALAAGEAILRDVGNPLDLAKLLCTRGRFELSAGDLDHARAALCEAEAVAMAINAGPASALGHDISKLRTAIDKRSEA